MNLEESHPTTGPKYPKLENPSGHNSTMQLRSDLQQLTDRIGRDVQQGLDIGAHLTPGVRSSHDGVLGAVAPRGWLDPQACSSTPRALEDTPLSTSNPVTIF